MAELHWRGVGKVDINRRAFGMAVNGQLFVRAIMDTHYPHGVVLENHFVVRRKGGDRVRGIR